MKILHIITTDNYLIIEPYIRFIHDYFNESYHSFTVVGKEKISSINTIPRNLKGFTYFNSYLKDLIGIKKHFSKFDKLIFHGLFPSYIFLLVLIKPSIVNKFVWVAWGADLYGRRKSQFSIKKQIVDFIMHHLKRRINNFVGIFPPDIEYFKQKYNSNATTFHATYIGGLYNPLFKKKVNIINLEEKIRNNNYINIQIGHQCNPSLNHIQVIKDLYKFRDKKIKVYIPLSYGDRQYGDKIEGIAKSMFGDKAICIRELMDKAEYMKFLSKIDIAIFNTQRQIGLGNLTPLRYMEKKIYIPAESVMYKHFRSQGINICDYNEIAIMDYDKFIQPVDMKKAKSLVQENSVNVAEKVEMWQNVFNAPLKQI